MPSPSLPVCNIARCLCPQFHPSPDSSLPNIQPTTPTHPHTDATPETRMRPHIRNDCTYLWCPNLDIHYRVSLSVRLGSASMTDRTGESANLPSKPPRFDIGPHKVCRNHLVLVSLITRPKQNPASNVTSLHGIFRGFSTTDPRKIDLISARGAYPLRRMGARPGNGIRCPSPAPDQIQTIPGPTWRWR
jgi:hypothetical protein